MARLERFYRLDQLLRTRKSITRREIEDRFEISRATFKRDLEYLRDRLNYPIVYDYAARAYRLESGDGAAAILFHRRAALDERDPRAMLVGAGALAEIASAVPGLSARADEMQPDPRAALAERMRVIPILWPKVAPGDIQTVIDAIVGRRQVEVVAEATCSDSELTAHEISPQRLTKYCSFWYLDAWCHSHSQCTSVRIRTIESAALRAERAVEVGTATLQDNLDARYGLHTPTSKRIAELEFRADAVGRINGALWSEAGVGERRPDGSYVLRIPFSDARDLVPEILWLGEQVRVLAPDELRDAVMSQLTQTLAVYDVERT
jgi:predicted DNA-binding transcriptional regulator YafY